MKYLGIILLFVMQSAYCQSSEFKLKSGFIEKFARFTNWPKNVPMDTFYITVIGKNIFYKELNEMAQRYTIKNRKIKITYVSDIKNLKYTHLLFVPLSEDKNLASIINIVKNKPILTIGESPKCVDLGFHFIFFETGDETLSFKVNPRKITESGLDTDLYLMSFGQIIK